MQMRIIKVGKKVNACYTKSQLQKSSQPLHFPHVFGYDNTPTAHWNRTAKISGKRPATWDHSGY
jgi:hypothetical protein